MKGAAPAPLTQKKREATVTVAEIRMIRADDVCGENALPVFGVGITGEKKGSTKQGR